MTTASAEQDETGRAVRALVLGHSRLEVNGAPVDLSRTQRRLLARLAAAAGAAVEQDDLRTALWDGDAPATARAAIHNQVSRLRAAAGRDVIVTATGGYRLGVPTDFGDLREQVRSAERFLADDPEQTLACAERALTFSTGTPFADLYPPRLAADLRREVEELLAGASDHLVEAALALGLVHRALPEARRAAAAAPVDEARALRLARALDGSGQRGEALAEIARVRRAMRTQLGLHGSPDLDAAESEIRGAAPVDEHDRGPTPRELDAVVEAARNGRSVRVSADAPGMVHRLLLAARDVLAADGIGPVALTEIHGHRDVAVAGLLDLLDLLGIEPAPELGPVGTFAPAIAELAAGQQVVLLVDGFDVSGPSTRHALMQAAASDGVTLIAGFRGQPSGTVAEGFEVAVAVRASTDDDARREALRRRIAALPRDIRETLTAVAVAGEHVEGGILRELGVALGLPGALARELLVASPEDSISFVSSELRELLAVDTPAGIRDELNHAIGRALISRGRTTEAAGHLLASADIEPAAAVQAARTAAAQSSEAGAHHDAAGWLKHAISSCRDERTRVAVSIELGDALRLSGDPSHVEVLQDAAHEAIRRRDDELLGEAVFALLQLGGTTVSTSLDPAISDLLERTLRRLRDDQQVALVKGAASLSFSMTGEAERSRALFVESEQLARDPATRRRILPFAYMSLGTPGDRELRRNHASELLSLAASADDATAAFEGLHLLASTQIQDGDGEGLRRTHAEMTGLVDRAGAVGRRWALHYTAAAIAHLDGDAERTERLSTAAFTQFAPVSESRATAVLFGQLFGLRLNQGRVAELRPVLESLVTDQAGVPAWNAALSLAVVESDPQAAIDWARRALDLVQPDLTWLVAQLVAARGVALALRGELGDRRDEALAMHAECTERLLPCAGHMSWQGTCSYGPVDTTLALLADVVGNNADSRRYSGSARTQAERFGAPIFVQELELLGLAPA